MPKILNPKTSVDCLLNDLKTQESNLKSATFKLCDFGFNRQLKPHQLVTGTYGTVNYMAPEIARQQEYGV
jgi:serine/threonine protein kinase